MKLSELWTSLPNIKYPRRPIGDSIYAIMHIIWCNMIQFAIMHIIWCNLIHYAYHLVQFDSICNYAYHLVQFDSICISFRAIWFNMHIIWCSRSSCSKIWILTFLGWGNWNNWSVIGASFDSGEYFPNQMMPTFNSGLEVYHLRPAIRSN